ncbi:VWA domain-containing protein [Alteromonas sp. ASW11-19]|uniref:VWA domain-containing protein n=1 Tax=Alteromonas salexigens TaxID=2982530 RepID=A0ABT2VQL9_9ALTE|nr:VWA domain-containing protein [Alteromonas salexigens]MCU7555167.1 VWA domain-containing protein [Alteromonas salexigens]
MDIPFAQFHFLRPEWFLALLPLLALLFAVRQLRHKQSGWQQVVANHLYQHMVAGKAGRGQRPPFWLLAAGWLLAVVALAGPTWERLPQPVYQLNTGHVVVIDMSLSMRATDVSPDRLTRAKYKAIDLVNQIGEGEMGLVAYAGDAFVISPLTSDASNLTTLLPSLSPEIMPVTGSDPLLGIRTAADLLEQAGYTQGSIYWITDGIERDQQSELQSYIRKLPYTVSVLGVGTREGAPIRQLDGELLKQTSGAIVIPKMDSGLLKGISQAGGGRFTTLTADDRDIKYLAELTLSQRQSGSDSTDERRAGDQWQELGPYLLLLLIPLAAYGFRRGIILFLLLPALVPLSPPAHAQEAPADPVPGWQRPFLNDNQEAAAAFDAQQFEQAASQFENPAWRGAAHYKAGNYAAAAQAYSQLNTPQATYNQANALAKMGELDAAIKKYAEVLEANPDHEDAATNKALLESLKDQQKQQQQQDSQSSDSESSDSQQGDNGESSDSSSDNGDQSQGESGEGEDQPQEGESPDSGDQSQQGGADSAPQNEDDQPAPSAEDSEPQPGDTTADEQAAQEDQTPIQNSQSEQAEGEPEGNAGVAGEMTEEQKEAQQRLDNLLRRVPDDPAYLLKRKMQLEAQQRRRQRMPTNRSEW